MTTGGIEVQSQANIEKIQNRSGHTIAYLEMEMMRALRYERPLSVVGLWTASDKSADVVQLRQVNLSRRLTRLAPQLLRYSDFWGRVDKTCFVLVLTETDMRGAEQLVARLCDVDPFRQVLQEESGRDGVSIGAAALTQEMRTAKAMIEAAHANVVWNTATSA